MIYPFVRGRAKPLTVLETSSAQNHVIYAKWTPLLVEFAVQIKSSMFFDANNPTQNLVEVLAHETNGIAGSYTDGGATFTYQETLQIAYKDTLFGEGTGHLHLGDYPLRTYSAGYVSLNGTRVDAATTVSRAILQQYQALGTPIPLQVSYVSRTRLGVTLDLNLNGLGLPKDSVFNYTEAPDERFGSTQIKSNVDVGGMAVEGKVKASPWGEAVATVRW